MLGEKPDGLLELSEAEETPTLTSEDTIIRARPVRIEERRV